MPQDNYKNDWQVLGFLLVVVLMLVWVFDQVNKLQ